MSGSGQPSAINYQHSAISLTRAAITSLCLALGLALQSGCFLGDLLDNDGRSYRDSGYCYDCYDEWYYEEYVYEEEYVVEETYYPFSFGYDALGALGSLFGGFYYEDDEYYYDPYYFEDSYYYDDGYYYDDDYYYGDDYYYDDGGGDAYYEDWWFDDGAWY